MKSGMRTLVLLSLAIGSHGIHNDCPDQADGCVGTAVERSIAAMERARAVDLNREWPLVRDDFVRACGLRVQQSTSHCFNDFNHVDCCVMHDGHVYRTNEESRVVGMHRVNALGTHILAASLTELGSGGSWCTCHLSSPEDVCHKQCADGPRTRATLHGAIVQRRSAARCLAQRALPRCM